MHASRSRWTRGHQRANSGESAYQQDVRGMIEAAAMLLILQDLPALRILALPEFSIRGIDQFGLCQLQF